MGDDEHQEEGCSGASAHRGHGGVRRRLRRPTRWHDDPGVCTGPSLTTASVRLTFRWGLRTAAAGERSPLVCRSLSLPVENYPRAARVRRTSFFCDSSPRHERREGSGSVSAGKRAMHTSGHDDARGIAHTPHASAGDATPALAASALLPPLIASTPFTNFPATVVSGCERYAADVVAHVVAVALPGLLERPR